MFIWIALASISLIPAVIEGFIMFKERGKANKK